MRLIIGGAHAGKRDYAAQAYQIDKTAMADGAVTDPATVAGQQCVYNFHLLVRRLREQGRDPIAFAEGLAGSQVVILMDEIGSGIVPMEKSERQWREDVGRTGCALARQAETVQRVVCGLAVKLKG